MSFLNPTYLWALLGLLIPIIIHLWSNKSGKTVKVGSIQFLKESESSQSRSIRLNEFVLLLLRLAIIALIAFILAEPVWTKSTKNTDLVYLVESSLVKESKVKQMLDSISSTSEVRLLTEGFPEYNETIELGNHQNQTPNYWQLAQKFNSLQTDSIVVFTKALSSGIFGSRPTIPNKTSWITIPTETNVNQPLLAYKTADSVVVFSLESNYNLLTFNKKRIKLTDKSFAFNEATDSVTIASTTIPVSDQKTIRVQLIDDASTKNDSKFLIDALRAIETFLQQPIAVEVSESYSEKDTELLIWNSLAPIPSFNNTLLYFSNDALASKLIEKTEYPNQYKLTSILNSENVIDQHFTEQLMELIAANYEVEKAGIALDQRTIASEQLASHFFEEENMLKKQATFGITKWLWLLLIPILIGERILAKFRKQ